MYSAPEHDRSDAYLIGEIERTAYEYSPAFEGQQVQTIDTGDALLHIPESPGPSSLLSIGRLTLTPASADKRLDELLALVASHEPHCWWLLGPSTQPIDLPRRLEERGLQTRLEWNGMALRDLSIASGHSPHPEDYLAHWRDRPGDPVITVELLSAENAAEFARFLVASSKHRLTFEQQYAAFVRMLAVDQRDATALLARYSGIPVGYAVLRVELNGIAYFRQGFTLPEYRGRGIYHVLITARLAVARSLGCTAAVVQAVTTTSSPILAKLGFVTLCGMTAYARPRE